MNLTLVRYVIGQVSTLVMKSDEETVERRAQLESVESLLKDSRIGEELGVEIRQHFRNSQNNRGTDQTAIFRCSDCDVVKAIWSVLFWLKLDSKLSHSLQVEVATCTSRFLDARSKVQTKYLIFWSCLWTGNIWTMSHFSTDAVKKFLSIFVWFSEKFRCHWICHSKMNFLYLFFTCSLPPKNISTERGKQQTKCILLFLGLLRKFRKPPMYAKWPN